ncbi:hypothetical protein ACWGST_00280 [Agromyces sp. NPDC055520]
MVRRRLLLIAISAAVTFAPLNTAEAPPDPDACSGTMAWVDGCATPAGTLTPTEAILEAVTSGGGDAPPPLAEQSVVDDALFYESEEAPKPEPAVSENCSPLNPQQCWMPPTEPDPSAPVPGTIITLRDIASFVPAKPVGDMEPRGWAVRDLPANFIADASTQIITGTLLGQPADVRFTPVGYRWTHSDGGLVESATPGTTWESLGLREFTATDTSHQYDESGRYTVTLDIVLRAEYRFAGSAWRPIAGTLTITGDPQPVLVGQIDTVLVDSDCIQNPTGPGC